MNLFFNRALLGHVEIKLNETHDSVEFSEKLMSDVTYWDENTNTSGALRVMRTEVRDA